jgi:hypothetical protein
MENICKTCYNDPGSHSFSLICKTDDDEYIFYTKFANAKLYADTKGIVNHVHTYLSYINPDKWIWIVDCVGFEFKHSLEIQTALGLINIIKTYGKLQSMIITNSNMFFDTMFAIVKVVITDELKKKIFMFKKDEMRNLYINQISKFNITNSDEKEILLNI